MQDPSPPTSPHKRRNTLLFIVRRKRLMSFFFVLVLIAVTWICYFNTLNAPFNFDDFPRIVNDPHIRLNHLNWENISSLAQTRLFNRPFSILSFALNYYAGQYDVTGFHIVNILIHLFTGILLFLFIRITYHLNNYHSGTASNETVNSDFIAFFAALVWVAHPMNTQSVTYIVQRGNSLSAMFYLLSIILYIKGRSFQRQQQDSSISSSGVKRNPYPWFAGSVFAGTLALASKENAATLPFFIILYEWFFFQDLKNILKKQKLFWIAAAVIAFTAISLIYLGERSAIGKILSSYKDYDFTIFERIMSEWRVMIYYLSLTLFPAPSRLTMLYDYPISFSLLHPATTIICFGAILSLIGLAVISVSKNRILSFCILWFFGNLFIESSFLPLALVFEHRAYLPSMMVCFAVVTLFYRFSNYRKFLSIAIVAVVVLFSFWTHQRNAIWTDKLSFWKDGAMKSPNHSMVLNNFGIELFHQARFAPAIQYFRKSLIELSRSKARNNQEMSRIYRNLGAAKLEINQVNEAITCYQKAIKIYPYDDEGYIKMASALIRFNKLSQAQALLNRALTINPNNAQSYFKLGMVMLKSDQIDSAMTNFQKALDLAPHDADIHNNLANVYVQKYFKKPEQVSSSTDKQGKIGDQSFYLDQAMTHYKASLQINPDYAKTYNNMGNLFVQTGEYDQAIEHYKKALAIDPFYNAAKMNLRALREYKKNTN